MYFSDMGVMRPDGGFLIKGRTADAMRFKVFAKVHYPAPIEEALGSHPSIRDISVSVSYHFCVFMMKVCLCFPPPM